MDVLIPDITVAAGAKLAGELARRGHEIQTCKRLGQSSSCAVLDGIPCPLTEAPIDVAVCVSKPVAPWERGDGATCAAVRRIPLVLVDAVPDDPLIGFAAALVSEDEVVATVESVAAAPLVAHGAVADKIVREDLGRSGIDPSGVAVEVRRRSGTLLVELWRGDQMSREDAERLAVHVVQAVREYDGWARGIDAVIHDARHLKLES